VGILHTLDKKIITGAEVIQNWIDVCRHLFINFMV